MATWKSGSDSWSLNWRRRTKSWEGWVPVCVHVHSSCFLEPLDVCVRVQRCLPQLSTFALGSVLPRTHTCIYKQTGQI